MTSEGPLFSKFSQMKKVLLFMLFLSGSSIAFAQESAAQFLNNTPDAKTLATGGASVASEANAFSFWNNAAAAGQSSKTMSAAAAFGLFQPNTNSSQIYALSGFGRIGKRWSVTAGGKMQRYSSYDIADENGIFTGSFTPSEMSIGAGVGFNALPCLTVSAAFNYIRSDIGAPQVANAFAADLGVFFSYDALRAGLSASNLGTSINYGGADYSLPMHVDLGAGYTLGKGSHKLSADIQAGYYVSDSFLSAKGGLSYLFKDLLRLSGGYCWNSVSAIPSYATLGAGLSIFGVSLDIAYVMAAKDNPMANTLMFNLGYSF